ncbi:head maturation protease, ClpP-related [Mariniflexile gromovii]|uniref:ATP-dependent Clp protease proteolytic subunit n=1 Tax=Mariniflexile gromovii TaxID=362523 RepID=A0ABS4BUV4_9FLAO|nr:head maturation protease, ClpP-related [Mariniflexile gromovii]MBP0904168.1 Clp protease ClpP [Mariniflexile gromovii]
MSKLTIYGEIGKDVIDTKFIASLQKKTGDITVKINSPGGSVFHGYAIYNALKEYDKGKITVHIDGVAASMASVICLAGHKIIMAKNAMYMIHNPQSGGFGESKDLRKQADLLDKIKSVLMETYSNKTGIKNNELAGMLDDETWLTSDEALKLGFVDEIKNDTLTKVTNIHALEPNEIFACYVINKPLNMNKKLLKLLELSDGASDDDVLAAVKKILPKKNEEAGKEVKAVIDEALLSKKITTDMTPHFTKMLQVDFQGTKELLNKMHGRAKLSDMLNHQDNNDTSKDRSKWGLDEYRMYAPNELKRDPKLYKKLVDAEFNNQD